MKRFLSAFLAVCMMFSMMTVGVYAEEDNTDPDTDSTQEEISNDSEDPTGSSSGTGDNSGSSGDDSGTSDSGTTDSSSDGSGENGSADNPESDSDDTEISPIACGTFGVESSLYWELTDEDEDGSYLLTITYMGDGEGDAMDTSADNIPWGEYASSITEAVIGYGVTSVGDYAFYMCTSLTSVVFEESEDSESGSSVESIGDYAFYYCESLPGLEIPDSVTSIGNYAFANAFEAVEISSDEDSGENGDDSALNSEPSVDDNAEAGNAESGETEEAELTTLVIPDSVTSIGTQAFLQSGLQVVVIGNGLISISYEAFRECTELEEITIGCSVTSIDGYAFYGCTALNSVTFVSEEEAEEAESGSGEDTDASEDGESSGDDSGTSEDAESSEDDSDASEDAESSEDDSENNEGEENSEGDGSSEEDTEDEESSEDTESEESYTYNLTSIGQYAFYGCSSLESVTLPESLITIGMNAFSSSGLTSIVIPDSVTTVSTAAFSDCTALESVILSTNEKFTTISTNTFSGCESLTSIVIPSNITRIESYAFEGSGLTAIDLYNDDDSPCSVTYIGSYAFANCEDLASASLGSNVTSMGDHAFSGSGLTSITVPGSVQTVGSYLFSGCTSLTSAILSSGVPEVSAGMFYGCTSLKSVTLPTSVTSIGDYAFYNCTSLTGITIPGTVTTIGNYAFRSCTSLRSITIPDSVTSLGKYAFADCTGLSAVSIGEGLTEISTGAFAYCDALTSITIPDNITIINEGAFYDCNGLTNVTISKNIEYIYAGSTLGGAFASCNSLQFIYFLKNAPYISSRSFSGVTAYAYYPEGIDGWDEVITSEYGGDITWVSYETYTLTLYSEDGDTYSSDTYNYNDEVVLSELEAEGLERDGYILGWSYTQGGEAITDESITVEEDVDLYAVYTPLEYTLTLYNYDGTEILFTDTIWHDEVLSLSDWDEYQPDETKIGYGFGGWAYEMDGEALTEDITVSGELVLYSVWAPTEYDLYIYSSDEEDAEILYESGVDYDDVLQISSLVEDPTRTGYTFSGWADQDGTEYGSDDYITITSDVTLYAQWTVNTYTLTLYILKGEELLDGEFYTTDIIYGVTYALSALPEPELTGYSFQGWLDADGNAVEEVSDFADDVDLYADMDPNAHTLYLYNGEELLSETTVYYDDTIVLEDLETPEKEGYTFSSWTDADGVEYTEDILVTGDVYLYAGWTPNPFTLYLYSEEELVSELTIYYDATVVLSELETPAKEGYTFVCWTDAEGSEASDFTVSGDASLYASWTPNPYTLTIYDEDLTTVFTTETIYYDDTLVLDDLIPEKEGHTFKSWTDAEGSRLTDDITVTGDVDLYTTWTVNRYTLYLYNETEDNYVTEMKVYYGSTVELSTLPELTKTGYTFVCWIDEEGNEYTSDFTMGAADLTLFSTWTPNIYTLTVDNGQGTLITEDIEYDSTVLLDDLPQLTRTGYTFAGWTDEDGNAVTEDLYVTGDITLCAAWDANPFTLTLYDEDLTTVLYTETIYYDDTITPDSLSLLVSREGYTISGWTDADGSEVSEEFTVTEDVSLSVSWTPDPYTLTLYDDDLDTVLYTETIYYDDILTWEELAGYVSREGYSLTAWTDTDGNELTEDISVTEDVTLYAVWIINTYTFTLYNGNDLISTRSYDYGTTVSLDDLPSLSKDNYDFTGWYDAEGNPIITEDSSITATEDLDLYAGWTLNTFELYLYAEDELLETRVTTYGDTLDLEELIDEMEEAGLCEKTGYYLSGWTDGDGNELSGEITITDYLSLYAVWSPNEYVLTLYDDDGETVFHTEVIYYDDTIVLDDLEEYAVPDEHYELRYWTDEDGERVRDDITVTGNVDLYAVWQPERFTRTLYDDDGSVLSTTTIVYGRTIDLDDLDTPTKHNYEFAGWVDEDGNAVTEDILVTGDVNLYATWIQISSSYDECQQDSLCPISQYTDSDVSAWYHDGVHYAIEYELMTGTSDTTWEPDSTTTRATVVTVLYRLYGSPEVEGTSSFTDVEEGQWYTDAVIWAEKADIAKGYDNGEFGINDPVTREQLATFMYRYAELMGDDTTAESSFILFTDRDDVSEWAETELSWALGSGLINGLLNEDEYTLAPGDSCTRAMMATIIYRYEVSSVADEIAEETAEATEALTSALEYSASYIDEAYSSHVTALNSCESAVENSSYEDAVSAQEYFSTIATDMYALYLIGSSTTSLSEIAEPAMEAYLYAKILSSYDVSSSTYLDYIDVVISYTPVMSEAYDEIYAVLDNYS